MTTKATARIAPAQNHVSKLRHAAEIAGALALAIIAGVGVVGTPSSPLTAATGHTVATASAPDITVAPCEWYVTGRDIPADTTHADCVTPAGALLTVCQHEDSDNCFWDARVQGNHVGRSFYTIHGVTTYGN